MLHQVLVENQVLNVSDLSRAVSTSGLGPVRAILQEAVMPGWENNCWLVEMGTGEVKAITKRAGHFVDVPAADLARQLERTLSSATAIGAALTALAANVRLRAVP